MEASGYGQDHFRPRCVEGIIVRITSIVVHAKTEKSVALVFPIKFQIARGGKCKVDVQEYGLSIRRYRSRYANAGIGPHARAHPPAVAPGRPPRRRKDAAFKPF